MISSLYNNLLLHISELFVLRVLHSLDGLYIRTEAVYLNWLSSFNSLTCFHLAISVPLTKKFCFCQMSRVTSEVLIEPRLLAMPPCCLGL